MLSPGKKLVLDGCLGLRHAAPRVNSSRQRAAPRPGGTVQSWLETGYPAGSLPNGRAVPYRKKGDPAGSVGQGLASFSLVAKSKMHTGSTACPGTAADRCKQQFRRAFPWHRASLEARIDARHRVKGVQTDQSRPVKMNHPSHPARLFMIDSWSTTLARAPANLLSNRFCGDIRIIGSLVIQE